MKIVLALALVACVYVQAAPVSEDGAGKKLECHAEKMCDAKKKCKIIFTGKNKDICKKHYHGQKMTEEKSMKCLAKKVKGKIVFLGKNKKECEEHYKKMKSGDADGEMKMDMDIEKGVEDGAVRKLECHAEKMCEPKKKCKIIFTGKNKDICKKHYHGQKMTEEKSMKCLAKKVKGKIVFVGKNKKECEEHYKKMKKAGDGDEDGDMNMEMEMEKGEEKVGYGIDHGILSL